MTDPTARPRIIRKRKKQRVPLSKLRMTDAVKILSDSPHRLEELLCLLEDRNRRVRDRAAATLSRLATLHPARLLRSVPRIREMLLDESAYVRWHLVYTLGVLIARYPLQLRGVLQDLMECLEDQNRIVQILASKALAQIAVRNPNLVEDAFRCVEKTVPPIVADILNNSRAANIHAKVSSAESPE